MNTTKQPRPHLVPTSSHTQGTTSEIDLVPVPLPRRGRGRTGVRRQPPQNTPTSSQKRDELNTLTGTHS